MFSNVHLSLPNWDLFQLPPSNDPLTLLPPAPGSSRAAPPFAIPSSIYQAALDIKVPITIASVYAITAITLNRYNKSTGNKPWAISKTRAFSIFVVLHNIFLAVYSAWTFYGMSIALYHTFSSWSSTGGFASTLDSLCKNQGVSGLGNAVIYDPYSSEWVSQNPATAPLTISGLPNSTDLGRFWSEGLAFYGWFFYLSKFYEVLDTLIILAKGKKSSTLQTYHHAGAMMCMWAGIRYMSPPIWLFVFLNSFIHTLMVYNPPLEKSRQWLMDYSTPTTPLQLSACQSHNPSSEVSQLSKSYNSSSELHTQQSTPSCHTPFQSKCHTSRAS